MSNYECGECNKMFSNKFNYERHLNRKNKCYNKTYTEDCVYCNKIFSTKSSVTRHIKSNCKIFKKKEIEKKNIYDELTRLKEENNKLKKENKKLKNKTKSEKGLKKITKNIITNNVGSINIESTKNKIVNNNNITIVAYGKEDISDIDIKQILAAVSRGYQTPVQLTKTLHFNPKHPEFHNIYIPSMKDSYAMIYDGQNWKLVQKTGLIDNIYEDKKDYIEENLEEFSKSLSVSKLKALKRWLESDEDDDKCIRKIKKDIELLLYNSKKIPLDTRKMIK